MEIIDENKEIEFAHPRESDRIAKKSKNKPKLSRNKAR